MTSILKKLAAASAITVCLAAFGFSQSPLRLKTVFTVNVDRAVGLGHHLVLSPGTYVLYQDSQNPDLFALYAGDMTHAPIAQIFTNRTPYWADRHRGETRIELRMAENGSSTPMLKGWTIPYEDRFNVVSVDATGNSSYITRVQ